MAEAKRARKESARYRKLHEGFSIAAHSLLTACSQQDIVTQFSFAEPELQNHVYEIYKEVVAAIHKASKDELDTICAEMKVNAVLTAIDKHVAEELNQAKPVYLPEEEKPPGLVVVKDVLDAKQKEVEELNRILLEEENKKSELIARISAMRNELETMDDNNGPPALERLDQVLQTASSNLKW